MRLKKICFVLIIISNSILAHSQEFGMSFSYFIPKNGYFSNPVAPLSIRDVGYDFGKYLSLTTGITLYRMAGMSVKGMPLDNSKPLIGPFFAPLIPLELDVHIPVNRIEFLLRGGGFAYYTFANHINYGNFDRAIRASEELELVNSHVHFENNPGYGYFFGSDMIVKINKHISVSLKGNYFNGSSPIKLQGTFQGWSSTQGMVKGIIDYPDSKIDFTGLEIGVGVSYRGR